MYRLWKGNPGITLAETNSVVCLHGSAPWFSLFSSDQADIRMEHWYSGERRSTAVVGGWKAVTKCRAAFNLQWQGAYEYSSMFCFVFFLILTYFPPAEQGDKANGYIPSFLNSHQIFWYVFLEDSRAWFSTVHKQKAKLSDSQAVQS